MTLSTNPRSLGASWYRVVALVPALICLMAASKSTAGENSDEAELNAVWEITEVVMSHHVDPPSRQQILLEGAKALYRRAGESPPGDLSEQFSQSITQESLMSLVVECLENTATDDVTREEQFAALYAGMMYAIPGPVAQQTGKEYAVNQSLRENRYVGVGIRLSVANDYPQIVNPFPGGPARLGGAEPMDLIVRIDGESTKSMPLNEVVEKLRGPIGTEVVVEFQSGDGEPREAVLVRDQIPIASIEGTHLDENDEWVYRLDEEAAIACLKMTSITGSTAQELREVSRLINSQGVQGLILDLRSVSAADLHHTVLVADAMLQGGTIGHVQGRDGLRTYEARQEAVFVDTPMVVLVDQTMGPNSEWLAASLQDNGRAVLVGSRSRTTGFVYDEIELERSEGVLTYLAVGYFLRNDGSWLSAMAIPGAHRPANHSRPSGPPEVPGGVRPNFKVVDDPNTPTDELAARAVRVLKDSEVFDTALSGGSE